ncbi:cytochrome c oxidase assembly protein COX16 homolog, mitochondrial-like isoform X2 [Homarus americanus]|uniref:cytochrome c oxidase assembly protein COX16 homolog, mitochondrial-like isoform X2 n=1 Tax=Homarus americanus TaxID=6706 RepID=UPI001C493EF0|nr:cytochrome c oxidase assembly protein COX16 homolog, mitochondrial-like isoform X2 [Homarus americanus]
MCDPDLLEKKTIQLNLKDSELTVCGEVVRESCVGMGSRFLKGKFMRFGAPFLVLVVGGSFGLKEFSQIRYDFRNRKNITKEDAEKLGIPMKPQAEVTLETEYKKITKIDTSNWENIRGPRPWEDGNKLYEEAVQRGKQNTDKAS